MNAYNEFDQLVMRRCLHLADLGSYHVGQNPLVGAVITYENKVIGEGYHRKFGGHHAEVEALSSIKRQDKHLLSKSHLYVSLEPCNHHGKTPPCVDAIIAAGIPKVFICTLDPNPKMSGRSVDILRENGVIVSIRICEDEGRFINRKYWINQKLGIPWITLKYAQSKDGFIGRKMEQVWLSNSKSNLLVHRWREESDAIMVGTNTVITDNPELTNRRDTGRSPIRVILDREGRIPGSAKVFTGNHQTIVFTEIESYPVAPNHKKIEVVRLASWDLSAQLEYLYQKGVSSVMVEGGSMLLKSFIKSDLWHEARVIHTAKLLGEGIKAPLISGNLLESYWLDRDKVMIINNLKIDNSQM